jgi:hypothetical protein
MRMRKLFVVASLLTLLVSVSGCNLIKAATEPSPPPEPQARNIAVDPLPSTRELGGGTTVTLVEASVSTMSGPGEVFSYWQNPLPTSQYIPELRGSKGEVILLGSGTRGVIYPLNGVIPMRVVVPGPNGSSTTFELKY